MYDIFFAMNALVLLALLLGTITDLHRREVPDMVSYGLMAFGLGYRVIASVMLQSWTPLIEGLVGFGIFFALGALMFYTGQWGGGDSKILFGMGAALGIPLRGEMPLLGHFILNLIIIGAIYGLLWSAALACMNWKRFTKAVHEIFSDNKVRVYRRWVVGTGLVLLVIAFLGPEQGKIPLAMIVFIVVSSFYFFFLIRAVEGVCMYQRKKIKELVEGDWVSQDVVVNKRLLVRKGAFTTKSLAKIRAIVQQNQQTLRVRRSLCGYSFIQTIPMEKLRKNDCLCSSLTYFDTSFPQNHLLQEADLKRLETEYLRHHFLVAHINRNGKTREFAALDVMLTDVLLDDLYVGEIICGPHDLGLEKEQIAQLRAHKVQSVILKEGIPFIPSFLLAFIVTLWLSGNLLLFLL